MDEALLVAITVFDSTSYERKPCLLAERDYITCMMVLECQKPETEVCPSDIIIRDKDARNEKRRKNNKNGGSTVNGLEVLTTSCLVLTGEGNNGIVDAVFFATFSTTTETKNKYKILSNRSGLNENESESGLAELTYKTRKITSFPFDLKLEQKVKHYPDTTRKRYKYNYEHKYNNSTTKQRPDSLTKCLL